ncbi:MAG: alpha/beta hydrolase-fold protein [Anaeromyxobacter sp.]
MRATLAAPLLALACLAGSTSAAAQDIPLQGFVLRSKVLGQERKIMIWTPPGYERNVRGYPVLYLTDGPAQLPLVATTVDFLARHGRIPDLIIVGIAPGDRTRELAPSPGGAEGFKVDEAGAPAFLSFIETELIPWVAARYRTGPFKILAGHSMGGLFALHALAARPGLFQAVLAVSPTLSWNEDEPARKLRALVAAQPALKATVVVTLGDEGPALARQLEAVREAMKQAGPDLRFAALQQPGEDHATTPFGGFYQGLKFVFDGWRMPFPSSDTGPKGGLPALKAHYDALSKRLGWPVTPPELMVNLAGYQQLRDGNAAAAIATFQQELLWYPDSANAHDSLGEAFEKAGQLQDARREYRAAWHAGEQLGDPATPVYKQHFERLGGPVE